MRSFRRPAFEVPTLAPNGVAGRTRREQTDRYIEDGTVPSRFPLHWYKPDVRGFLMAMQHRICSYCGMASNGLDVEHFRPKGSVRGDPRHGGYWWLAYDSSNYFLACNMCNTRRKSTFFPLEAGAARIVWDTRLNIPLERRILLDPAEDAVEDLFELQLDDPNCTLFPNSSLDSAQQARVQFVIDFFGLNLDPEVRKRRALVFEKAVRAAHRNDWETLRVLAMPHNEHSFAARFVLRAIAPRS